MTDSARTGIYTYRDSTGVIRNIDLLALAAAKNPTLPAGTRPYATTLDPTIASGLGLIANAVKLDGALTSRVGTNNDFNRMDYQFQDPRTLG